MRLPEDPLPEHWDNSWVALAYLLCSKDAAGFQAAICDLGPEERLLAIRALTDTATRLTAMSGVCSGAASKIRKASA